MTHICAELSGVHETSGDTYHSDICFEGKFGPENGEQWHDWRATLHAALDEWLDNYSPNVDECEQYFRVGDDN